MSSLLTVRKKMYNFHAMTVMLYLAPMVFLTFIEILPIWKFGTHVISVTIKIQHRVGSPDTCREYIWGLGMGVISVNIKLLDRIILLHTCSPNTQECDTSVTSVNIKLLH